MARLPHTATPLGRGRSDDRGLMVLEDVQSFEADQKLTFAPIGGTGLGCSSRGSVRAAPRCSGKQGAVEMRRISIVGLCLAAVFVLSAMAASSASADLKAQLKGGGSVVGTTFLSSVTLPRLVKHNGKEIHCKDATNHGKFLTATLGDILIRFLGCTAGGFPCNTPGAASGEIHLPLTTLFHLGLAHLVLATSTDRVPAAVILPSGIIKISCAGGLVKIEVKGNAIGAFQKANGEPQPLNTAFTTVNLNFQETSTGLQHLKLILMPGSTVPTEQFLEANENGGAFEPSAEVANVTLNSFSSGGAPAEIELVEP